MQNDSKSPPPPSHRCHILTTNLLFIVLLVLVADHRAFVHSLQDNSTSVEAPRSANSTTLTAATTTTANEPEPSANGSELLLSGEEFVDYTEAPLLLFDGLANEPKNESTTVQPQPAASPAPPPTTTAATAPISENISTTTTTASAAPVDKSLSITSVENASSEMSNTNNNTSTNSDTMTSNDDDDSGDDGPETSGDEDETDPSGTGANAAGLDDLSTTKPFEPPQNVSQYMDYIETLFHDLRHQITDLFEPHIPQLIRTSQMVQLSGPCSYDMLRMALALRQFEPWALRMIDSSGKVPEGIFEGSFTALGSYDECLNTLFESSAAAAANSPATGDSGSKQTSPSDTHQQHQSQMQQQQQQPGGDPSSSSASQNLLLPPTQGKYCLVNVSPFLPPKPPADKVEKMFQDEANRRNITKDDQFSRLSPMFYYMKFRIGVCIPSTCDQTDMESISAALSSSLRLNITIPDCRVKQLVPMTSQQLVGGAIFSLVLAAVLGATLVDWWRRKWDQLERTELDMISVTLADGAAAGAAASGRHLASLGRTTPPWLGGPRGRSAGAPPPRQSFNQRLSKHWSWMSFSLLTNFRLYFKQQQQQPRRRHQCNQATANSSGGNYYCNYGFENDTTNSSCGDLTSLGAAPTTTTPATRQTLQKPEPIVSKSAPAGGQDRQSEQVIIKCLNGIRVLSLCWVIIANSYITLDPRATKRLAKTREAPKDFFFQLIVQASLAIETFFFLSGLLVSLSFGRRLRPPAPPTPAPQAVNEDGQQDSRRLGDSKEDIFVMENGIEVSERRKQKSKEMQQQQQQRRHLSILKWVHFYVHRYVRMTPATMLVIAFSMYAYRYGDGPLWFEATHKAHQSCSKNWWRHLLHVANFIDTRQMCFIHYWYIAADMQLFLFAPLLMYLIHRHRRVGYSLVALIGAASIGFVFYTTYARNLPPTLLFYNSDPESRREFGNTIMTKPLTHALPYIVGMLIGQWLTSGQHAAGTQPDWESTSSAGGGGGGRGFPSPSARPNNAGHGLSWTTLFGSVATVVALVEVFLPYKWNNSHLPNRLMASLYAALFRLGWSLVLAYVVVSCRHQRGRKCLRAEQRQWARASQQPGPNCVQLAHCRHESTCSSSSSNNNNNININNLILSQANRRHSSDDKTSKVSSPLEARISTSDDANYSQPSDISQQQHHQHVQMCFCGSGGNLVNRLLSLDIFAHLSKISFVAYLIHLPLMSVFVSQTRGLFAFSHTLVIHLALGYLVMTFILSFILVHIIEFPFITFERYLFNQFFNNEKNNNNNKDNSTPTPSTTAPATSKVTSKSPFHHHHHHEGNMNMGRGAAQPRRYYEVGDKLTSFKTDLTHSGIQATVEDGDARDRSRRGLDDEPTHQNHHGLAANRMTVNDGHHDHGSADTFARSSVSERL